MWEVRHEGPHRRSGGVRVGRADGRGDRGPAERRQRGARRARPAGRTCVNVVWVPSKTLPAAAGVRRPAATHPPSGWRQRPARSTWPLWWRRRTSWLHVCRRAEPNVAGVAGGPSRKPRSGEARTRLLGSSTADRRPGTKPQAWPAPTRRLTLPGVRQVDVELATGAVTVISESPLAESEVRTAVEGAGYQLDSAS